MERYKQLERRTRLRSDPVKTREWVDRTRKRLPSMSRKRRAEKRERDSFVAFVIKHRPDCEAGLPWCCTKRSREVNELQRGPLREDCWLDYNRVTSLCSFGCHAWITHHPDWAVRHGHQLLHEQVVTSQDWLVAEILRVRFREDPCTRDCTVDHRLEYA